MVTTLKYATVSIEEVLFSKSRLDANVYNVEARKAKEVLKECKWEIVKLWSENGLIESAFYPGRFKRIYVEKGSGYPMILPSQIKELKPQATKYISEKTFKAIGNLQVKKGTLLITRSGTIGVCTIVSNWLDGFTMSDDIIRVKFKQDYDLSFVYTYLLTDIGKTILKTNNYGSVIQHIEPEHLENIEIPKPTERLRQKIHFLIMQSFDLRDKSNELIQQAEDKLIKALKLPPIEDLQPDFYAPKATVRTFSVRLDELNNRLDSSFHNPVVEKMLDYFFDSGATVKRLKDFSKEVFIPGRFKRIYLEESESGVPFFSGKCIYELDPSNKKYISATIHKDRIGDHLTIKENMLLITCSGTTGKVSIVPEHWNNWVMTHDIVRFVPINLEILGYLYVFFNSVYGRELLQRSNYGSVVPHLEVEHVENTPVAIINDVNIVKEINDLALEANKLRTQAYNLEKQAVEIMNNEVLYA